MKIGYLYYKFYPVDGGAAIHGYYLAKELSRIGHQLFKLNGEQDPYTEKLSHPVLGFIWMLKNCDLFYVRMDFFLKPRNFLVVILLLFRKKIVVELNTPSDELILYGKSRSYIRIVDKIYSIILKRTDALIVVSSQIERYCREELGLENVTVIENGADRFKINKSILRPEIVRQVREVKEKGNKLIIWTGSTNKLQDLDLIKKIVDSIGNRTHLFLIVKEEEGFSPGLGNDQVKLFKELERADVEFIISEADAGLALYEDYSWCRWGFYNSSLKIFEYLNNSLITISNKPGSEVQKSSDNFYYKETPEEIVKMIADLPEKNDVMDFRSWKDVAKDTNDVIQSVVKS